MTIYIDVVFLENVILNFIILLATCVILKRKSGFFKILISSSIGSIYSIFSYVFIVNKLFDIFLKFIVSSCMIFIVFKEKKLKNFFRDLGVFYLTSLVFGGSSFMLLFWVKPESIIFNSGHFEGLYPVKMAIFGGIFAFVLIFIVCILVKRKIIGGAIICDLEIFLNSKSVKIKALLDSR